MSSDPRSNGGWYPRLSPGGEHCLSTWIGPPDPVTGVRPTASVVNGQIVVEDGYGGDWLNRITIVVKNQKTGKLVTWAIGDAAPKPLESPLASLGANVVAASNNVLAVSVSQSGQPPRTYLQYGADIEERIGYAQPALSESAGAYAYLGETGNVYFQHNLVDERACANPEFGGETLCYEYDAHIAGFTTLGQPRTELTVPGLRQWKPIPVWTGKYLVVLSFAAQPDQGPIAGKGYEVLQNWGQTTGRVVFEGISDGPHHARATDETHVRCVRSVGGVLQNRIIDLEAADGLIDLRTLVAPPSQPDVAWASAPDGTAFDIRTAWMATATAREGDVFWCRKGDPVENDPQGDVGAWLDLDPATNTVGLLADSSTGEKVNGLNDWMYFDKARLWFALVGKSGWEATYDCEFRWRHHVLAGKTKGDPKRVKVAFHVGRAVFKGVEVIYRHTYDASVDDGDVEYSYYDKAMREIRWEMWRVIGGKLTLIQSTQPVPFTGPEAFVVAPRPKPYGPIAGEDEMNAPGVTIDSYGPAIRPGQPWTVDFHDRNNDVHGRVEIVNGSLHVSLKNAKGEDRSGNKRPVTVQP